jgi:hypothetical protein
MQIKNILPSVRFTTMAGAIALAALLVWGAYVLTHHSEVAAQNLAVDSSLGVSTDWKAQLENIQAQSPNNKAPQAPDQGTVDTLRSAATSDNLTDTVARTLLINLSNAKAQGLGDDIPTQDQLIADAVAKINERPAKIVYANADLTISGDNSAKALAAYGNAFMQVVKEHPGASYGTVIYIVATSTDNGDPKRLSPLKGIGAEYAALAKALAGISVPSTLAPLHLTIVNNFEKMAEAVADLQKLYDDPLRGLAAFQLFDALNQETLRLFINIAQEFSQNGILFNNDDPGQAWSALVP